MSLDLTETAAIKTAWPKRGDMYRDKEGRPWALAFAGPEEGGILCWRHRNTREDVRLARRPTIWRECHTEGVPEGWTQDRSIDGVTYLSTQGEALVTEWVKRGAA